MFRISNPDIELIGIAGIEANELLYQYTENRFLNTTVTCWAPEDFARMYMDDPVLENVARNGIDYLVTIPDPWGDDNYQVYKYFPENNGSTVEFPVSLTR